MLVVDNDAYRFRHPLLGEVVYADLLPPQRMRLHRRIAEALQQQSTERLRRADRAGELAFHLDRSGDIEGAFSALLAAADAAETVAPGAAFGHLERAFELWDAAGQAAEDVSRGDRLWQAADLATSTVGNQRALELARAAFEFGPPPLGAPFGHERLGRYLWSTGNLRESRVEFDLAAALLSGDEGGEAALMLAGLGQAELMSANYESAERWCVKVFDLVPTPDDNPAAWVMARRVLGIVRSNQGDPDQAVELCREAVAAANNAQGRALATLYLCVALIDAGHNQAAINAALDAVAEGQLTGLDQGFGGYFDSLAAEALTRLGRWSEAATVLARHPIPNTLPVGLLRVARAGAMLAARRGETDRAIRLLAEAETQPVDGWHQSVRDAAVADVHLALGNWDEAALAAERGWESTSTTSVLWAARFAMLSVVATVEQALDERARRQPIDLPGTISRLQERIDAVRTLAATLEPQPPTRHLSAPRPCRRQHHPTHRVRRRRVGRRRGAAGLTSATDGRPRPHCFARPKRRHWPAPWIGRQRRSDTPTRSHPNSVPPRCWPRSRRSPAGPGSASKPQLDSCSTRPPPTASVSRPGKRRCWSWWRRAARTGRSATNCSCRTRPPASMSPTSAQARRQQPGRRSRRCPTARHRLTAARSSSEGPAPDAGSTALRSTMRSWPRPPTPAPACRRRLGYRARPSSEVSTSRARSLIGCPGG